MRANILVESKFGAGAHKSAKKHRSHKLALTHVRPANRNPHRSVSAGNKYTKCQLHVNLIARLHQYFPHSFSPPPKLTSVHPHVITLVNN